MKAILYIGHHKVGSTALQSFFTKNSYRFLENGILYPAVESEGLSYLLSKTLRRRDVEEPLSLNIREPHNALAFRMMAQNPGHKVPPFHHNLPGVAQMKLAIQNQLLNLDPHTVVMCSEVMANFGAVAPPMIDALRDMLPTEEIVLYCALRRPDEYLISWHGQRLKFGHHVVPLRQEATERYFPTIHFDYRKMLEPWVERFQDDTVIIRDYRDIVAAGGSTVDFCTQTGLDLPKGLIASTRANPSIPHALMEIVRRGNIELTEQDSGTLRSIIMAEAHHLDLPENGTVEMFGPRNRELIRQAFEPVDRYLCEVTGRDHFFPALDKLTDLAPVSEIEAAVHALDQLRTRISDKIPGNIRNFLDTVTIETGFRQ